MEGRRVSTPPPPIGGDIDAYLQMIDRCVEEYGFVVQHTIGNARDIYSYTVGLTERGLPELWLAGLLPTQAQGILCDVARAMLLAPEPLTGRVSLDWSADFRVQGPCALEETGMFVVSAKYPHPWVVEVSQVLWPDEEGRFPTDEDYNAAMPQRVLGLRGETL